MSYQQQPGYAPAPPPRKRHTGRWIVLGIVIVVVVIIAVSCGVAAGGAANDLNQHLNAPHKVTYEVGGTAAQVSVDYSSDGSGNQAQISSTTVPWTKTITMKGDVGVTLLAQNLGATGTVTCTTKVDGKVTSTNTSKGAYAAVTCG